MSAQNGRTMIIEEGDGGSPENFTLVAVTREDSFSGETGEINITDKSSGRYRELLEGGIQQLSLSQSGVARSKSLLKAWLADTIKNYRVRWEDTGDTLTGPFQIASYSEESSYENSAISFSAEFRSAGEFEFSEGS